MKTAISFLLALLASPVAANLVVNGSFEDNSAVASQLNMTNGEFGTIVSAAASFGGCSITQCGEIDLVQSDSFGTPLQPQDGDWKVGIHRNRVEQSVTDKFSLFLSTPVISGNEYVLQFFAASVMFDFPPDLASVVVGLSSSPASLGTPIFSGTTAITASWTQFDLTFTSPVNASYLTVTVGDESEIVDVFAWVDNFSLVTSELAGDFDCNGVVDGKDFLLWQRDPSVGSLADWEANYGTVATLSASSAAVPEPTTCVLVLAALCLAMSRRRSH